MQEYICSVCGFVYNPNTAEQNPQKELVEFRDLDPEWTCPNCGVKQDLFDPQDNEE